MTAGLLWTGQDRTAPRQGFPPQGTIPNGVQNFSRRLPDLREDDILVSNFAITCAQRMKAWAMMQPWPPARRL
jgi:hypothetical protein